MIKNKTGVILKKPNFTLEIKYSPEAIKNKLMRFTATAGDSFEISADEMISMLVNQVNTDTLLPAFVEMEKVNVVQVMRQIKCKLGQDMKAGDEIALNYIHPYPLEFAIIEEVYRIAKIENLPMVELTKEFIDKTKEQLKPEMEEYVKKFYKSYKQIELSKK